jgi:translation initiation factor IF-1
LEGNKVGKKNKKYRHNHEGNTEDDRDDKVVMEGVVEEALPATQFRVRIGQQLVLANLSGKMRQNKIRVLIADKVEIEFSPYDLSRGRITRRF